MTTTILIGLLIPLLGTMLGVIGMIIALPLTTLVISYYKHYAAKAKSKS